MGVEKRWIQCSSAAKPIGNALDEEMSSLIIAICKEKADYRNNFGLFFGIMHFPNYRSQKIGI